jgi:hypothetical protein
MKKILLILSVILAVSTMSCKVKDRAAYAQNKKETRQIKKSIKKRAIREARKQARQYKKAGWKVNPGSLPLEKTLEQAWIKQMELDDKGNTKYITSDGNGIAGNKTAAELQAIETGKLQLAGMLETRVAALVSANIANTELSNQEAETVTEVIGNSKNIIAKQMGYINPYFKMFRRLNNGNVEVQVKLFYNAEEAEVMAKKAIKKELKTKLKKNEEDLKKLMGM